MRSTEELIMKADATLKRRAKKYTIEETREIFQKAAFSILKLCEAFKTLKL